MDLAVWYFSWTQVEGNHQYFMRYGKIQIISQCPRPFLLPRLVVVHFLLGGLEGLRGALFLEPRRQTLRHTKVGWNLDSSKLQEH
jgi:hypothetical protein